MNKSNHDIQQCHEYELSIVSLTPEGLDVLLTKTLDGEVITSLLSIQFDAFRQIVALTESCGFESVGQTISAMDGFNRVADDHQQPLSPFSHFIERPDRLAAFVAYVKGEDEAL